MPVLGGASGHDLLRENVQRSLGNFDAIEISVTDRANQRGAFDQFIARGGEQAALGNRAAPVAGASDALQGHGDRARRADLADQVDCANINSQFKRSRGDQRAYFTGFQFRFNREPPMPRKAAVMRSDRVLPKQARQIVRHALRQTPCIHKNQRRAMLRTSTAMRS